MKGASCRPRCPEKSYGSVAARDSGRVDLREQGAVARADRFCGVEEHPLVLAAIDDLLNAAEGLDVVDDGRLAEQSFDGWERRLDAWPGSLPFQALDQAGLFSADVGCGPAVQDDVEIGPMLEMPSKMVRQLKLA